MANGNIAQIFQPQPLPEAAFQAASESIRNRGFPSEGILRDYSFSSQNNKKYPLTVNALSFAHPIHRNPSEYASFTVFNAANYQSHRESELVETLAESSAPFHLIHNGETFSFWGSAYLNNKIQPVRFESEISYGRLDNVLNDYAVDLKPQHIIDVKQGRDTFTLPIFRDIRPWQLSFWAAGVTRDLLVNHFGLAVNALRRGIKGSFNEIDVATDLAIQLLGAIILADTGVFGDHVRLNRTSANDLIRRAYQKFPRYFNPRDFEYYSIPVFEAYEILTRIRFAGFVPDMLRDLYLKAYNKEERKSSGSYDTPLYLTRRIWDNIPIEYLPPDKRTIVDMTCGWGSFLIAGQERISNLSDMEEVSMRELIHGCDEKYFTARLAGLGLLLSTSQDSWQIDHADAFNWEWLRKNKPNVIVGNPPFGADRKKSKVNKDEPSTDNKRQEKANKFLEFAINQLAPGGYLALLMPSSFSGAEASPKLRKKLLEECDVLEIWELPTGVFLNAAVQAIVIFAQKKANAGQPFHNPVRVRTVQPETTESFKNSGPFTASGFVIDQSNWDATKRKSPKSENTYIMDYKVILPEYIWRNVRSHSADLSMYAEIFRGATIGNGGLGTEHKAAKRNLSEYDHPQQVPWLTGVKNVMNRPFFIDYNQATTIIYPNDLQWPRLENKHIFESTKLLIAYDPHPTWGRRVKVAIERNKHYVSDSFWIITPKPTTQTNYITCEVLAAVLSWDVSNAWIVEFLKNPAIPKRAINTVPFPEDLSESDCQALSLAIHQIEDAAYTNGTIPTHAYQTIDDILKAAYHLDDATFERLRNVMEWDDKPLITLDEQPDREKTNWFLSGIVDSANAEQGTITLWLEGFNELQTVKIVPSMPGWILRPGAAFRTKIPRGYLKLNSIDVNTIDWDTFCPQPYTYLNEEELFEELSNLLREDDRNRI